MNTELEMVQKLYELNKSCEMSMPPKQTFISWKCPKCNKKLMRKSYKAPLYAEAGGNDFANRVISDYNLAPGLYNITMNHFTCSCDYVYISAEIDQVGL